MDISPFSDIWFVNISSPSVGCLFVLLMVCFALQGKNILNCGCFARFPYNSTGSSGACFPSPHQHSHGQAVCSAILSGKKWELIVLLGTDLIHLVCVSEYFLFYETSVHVHCQLFGKIMVIFLLILRDFYILRKLAIVVECVAHFPPFYYYFLTLQYFFNTQFYYFNVFKYI